MATWSRTVKLAAAVIAACALSATGCEDAHDSNLREVTSEECVACHLPDYQATDEPTHSTAGYSTFCGGCHRDDFWRPAIGQDLHREELFPIAGGPHAPFACEECHDPGLEDVPSAQGQNADCVGCHTGAHSRRQMDDEHEDVADYPAGDAPPNFCLDCHPAGRL